MPQFWRTLEERVELQRPARRPTTKVPPGAVPAGFDDVHGLPIQSGFSRRDFLGLVSATAALAATVACDRKGQGTVVPYSKRPVEVTPGVPSYYASATNEGSRTLPCANGEDPRGAPSTSRATTSTRRKGGTQPDLADVLRLYDPDRLRAPRPVGGPPAWSSRGPAAQVRKSAKSSGKSVLRSPAPWSHSSRKAPAGGPESRHCPPGSTWPSEPAMGCGRGGRQGQPGQAVDPAAPARQPRSSSPWVPTS
ncbi:MAG: twin-arginine translocation signal domain-containing protein [Holophagaceae bacterium]|uniref:Twin-arginine translocation signal domain-containing protein n=1 Tax=Candidatus Geothrix odensensis TaxID=2954440 RepID=A0A936F320_9BACT|nr:twin-arginine translocation signal domain-containing protein [Candidatus Geothrix odensensis]